MTTVELRHQENIDRIVKQLDVGREFFSFEELEAFEKIGQIIGNIELLEELLSDN